MFSTLLTTKDIGFETQQKTLFKNVSLSVARGDRIGLVGKNGEGKTTLLKILAGGLEPTKGSINITERTYYLPQLEFSFFERKETVSSFLKDQEIEWPLVRASLAKLFKATSITENREIRTLSGGELAKLLIAISYTANPDLLLLDEPTNHLDIGGLEVLKKFLLKFNGAFIVVSHDPLFFDHVTNTTWEIEDEALSVFGGNYSYYLQEKERAEEGRKRSLEAAKKEVKSMRKAIEAREKRSARAVRAGRKAKLEPSYDKMAVNSMRDMSEAGTGRLKKQQDKEMKKRKERVQDLTKLRGKTTHLDLSVFGDTSRRTLISTKDTSLEIDGEKLLSDINIRIKFGDRIAITGQNGSGKSLLVKSLIGEESCMSKEDVRRAEALQAIYFDQKYNIVDPEKSLIDNIVSINPHLGREEIYRQLGQFQFVHEIDIKKRAGLLSGGETARLALAMVTAQPIDLLILDEPTNNLDIETLDIIADALEKFPGALIVISHNIDFLSKLNIKDALNISNKKIKKMKNLPADEEEFYEELLSR